MTLENPTKPNMEKIIKTSLILLFVLIVIGGTLFFYFQNFTNRNNFPSQSSNPDTENLEKNNFKKVEYDTGNYSYYVPGDWILIDENTNSYSNILNGSSAYFASYPNNLGYLTPELCESYSNEIKDQIRKSPVFSNAELKSQQVSSKSGFEACVMVFESTVNGKLYEIRQLFFFRKERIYQLFIQYQKELNTQKDLADLIERSVEIQ